ncbi:unnamed protein product [Mycena citricolor]|uniref:Metallo-beta-lactamase domain-containing protein n=1 Tax=Mycena citricolor TaxID=2018698 RepID=A0AAD2GTF7_9AGAR|nr:unnamed protein product [Mycena citricolor]
MPTTIAVEESPAQQSSRKDRAAAGKPAHWVGSRPNHFVNPWPSFRTHETMDFLSLALKTIPQTTKGPNPAHIAQIPSQVPTWGASAAAENAGKIKATWLGHACFLVELPSAPGAPRGARILFDPVFSDRCSPSQIVGPKRFTPPPCKLEDIPEFDAVVISHNHYDHMDTASLRNLLARKVPSPGPHVFAPLGENNEAYFKSLGVPESRTHCLDWWDGRRVSVAGDQGLDMKFDVTFTPGQHFTGRGLMDRFKTLWGGWVVENVTDSATPPAKVYFAGDTGYRSVPSDTDEGPDSLPVCPAFKEIGEKWNGFDFAMIPIGAYAPRKFMSPIHCGPRDSVALFKDLRVKKALGMHWGAWVLTTEDVHEPPLRLQAECDKAGIPHKDFDVCAIGETVVFDAGS